MYLYIWLSVVLAIIYLYLRKIYSYFKKNDIHYLTPVPILGNMAKILLGKESIVDSSMKIYLAFPEDRFVGTFELINPVVVIRDPELIRLIAIKDFDHFGDHRSLGNQTDPFLSRSLFALKGQKWRDMRSTISPAFTASKLKGMVPLIQECSKYIVDHLNKELKNNKDGYVDIESRDPFTRYTNDVIATCVFGLKVNSIEDKNNEFYNTGCLLTKFTIFQILKIFFLMSVPIVSKVVDISPFPKNSLNFLRNIILSTMKERDEKNLFRPDLIQLLLEAKKGTLTHENVKDEKDAGFATVEESAIGKRIIKRDWEEEDLVAQALLFFFAGFDTVAVLLVFLMYELAVNPDVQDRLKNEIDECYENNKGEIDYDKINKMKYLDMVISETLRKWPGSPATDRLCLKRYNLGKPHDKATNDFYVDEGKLLMIPIWSLHYDPKYYPDPEKFDPERFSDENKHNIKPSTYLPFGIGPRNCIGSRFALTEVKIMAFDLIRHFEIVPAPKTRIPAQLEPSAPALRMLGGHWLRILPRNNQK